MSRSRSEKTHVQDEVPDWTRRRLLKTASGVTLAFVGAAAGCGGEDDPGFGDLEETSSELSGPAFQWFLSDGLADHPVGPFPNPGCPFAIQRQNRYYRIIQPRAAPSFTAVRFWEFGVCLNGVVFDPAGPDWNGNAASGWQFEVTSAVVRPHLGLDGNHAHTQPGGGYHYHAFSPYLRARAQQAVAQRRMALFGWAADGFPIYGVFGYSNPMDPYSPMVPMRSGYRLRSGNRPGGPGGRYDGTFVQDFAFVGGGHLDKANGRFGVTPEFPGGTYYYCLTDTFPYIPRYYRGTPDPTFAWHAQGPGLEGVPPALRNYRG